jgi:transcriptional regulator with XRE-family HTH domain
MRFLGVMAMNGNGIGDNFDDFMKEQGLYEEAKKLAAKKLLVFQLEQAMKSQNRTKAYMAKKMNTSRVAIDNILNPNFNNSMETLERFATLLGKNLTISLT